jgi:hypothetical protein
VRASRQPLLQHQRRANFISPLLRLDAPAQHNHSASFLMTVRSVSDGGSSDRQIHNRSSLPDVSHADTSTAQQNTAGAVEDAR